LIPFARRLLLFGPPPRQRALVVILREQ